MSYNKPDTKLDECIFIAEKIIPADFCDSIVQDIETRQWQPHQWYDSQQDTRSSFQTKELDIQVSTPSIHKALVPFIRASARQYNNTYFPSTAVKTQIINDFSPIRFNRYSPGQIMRPHIDHIHSLFDGKLKGVPVLTFILNFNDNYEGADLFFWEDTIVKVGKGDIVMFPSCFLFPHGVTEATKGKRYSASVWGW